MTYEELIDRTLRLLGDSTTDPTLWTREKIGRYLNDAYTDMARDTGALEVRVGIRTVADQGDYTIPDEVAVVQRVAYDDYELKADTARRLDKNAPGWQTETGTPERWTKSRRNNRAFTVYKMPTVDGPGDVTGGDYGKIVQFTDTGVEITLRSDYGRIVRMSGPSVTYRATSEYGRICQLKIAENNLEIWGKKNPLPLDRDDKEPELPAHAHMGLAFRAAEYALRQERDGRNEDLAKVYEAIADEYEEYLLLLVNNRMPERDWAPSQGVYEPRAYNLYRETVIPATGLPGYN